MLILIINFAKIVGQKARSPFLVIKRLNRSSRGSYQSHFNMKTNERPLIGAEIGVANGDNANQILNFLNIKQLILVRCKKRY